MNSSLLKSFAQATLAIAVSLMASLETQKLPNPIFSSSGAMTSAASILAPTTKA